MALTVGKSLPSFTLFDDQGNELHSESLLGKPLVLFFYPKDNTYLCTKEACSFRDSYSDFMNNDVQVVGISEDSIESHKLFKKKYNLQYPLLSDPEQKVRKQFGVAPDVLGLIPGRVTYCFTSDGILHSIIKSSISADKHVKESLKALTNI